MAVAPTTMRVADTKVYTAEPSPVIGDMWLSTTYPVLVPYYDAPADGPPAALVAVVEVPTVTSPQAGLLTPSVRPWGSTS